MAEILQPGADSLRKVVSALTSGEVVALPTETVYGLAAVINREDALEKIFSVKARPLIDPLIVHVVDLSSLMKLADVDDVLFNKLRALTDAFSPGPLTFVLKKKKGVSDKITAGKKTVAIRLPAHPLFREILLQTGPLAAPSANPFGYLSPTRPEHVLESIGDKIPYILDGGPCEVGVESTIIDVSGKKATILRPGAITAEQIEEVLKEKVEPYRPLVSTDPTAPGMLKQHYSPQTKLRLFTEEEQLLNTESFEERGKGGRVAVVYLSREAAQRSSYQKEEIFWLSEDGSLETVARNVFDLLQRLDGLHFDAIYFQVPGKKGIGIAINDRLSRAAAKFRT